MRQLDNISVNLLYAQAKPWTTIHDCVTECLILSAEEDQKVLLTHNDTEYLISAKKCIESIINDGGVKTNDD